MVASSESGYSAILVLTDRSLRGRQCWNLHAFARAKVGDVIHVSLQRCRIPV